MRISCTNYKIVAENSVVPTTNMNLVNRFQKEFKDFTYVPSNDLLHEK